MSTHSYGIFTTKPQKSIGKQVFNCKFTVPEAKIVFVLFHWIVHITVFYSAISIRAGRDHIFDHHLQSYTDCMAGGNRENHDCHKLRVNLEAETNPVVDVINAILLAFLNFVSLSFVIQFQTVKNVARKAARIFNIHKQNS